MPGKKTIYCNNRSVGRLLADLQRGALIEPGREEDRRTFFDEHLDECLACRDEMIADANQLALSEIAAETGVGVERVIEELGKTAKQLRDFANAHDISFEEVVIGILRGRPYTSTNSERMGSARSVASTEA